MGQFCGRVEERQKFDDVTTVASATKDIVPAAAPPDLLLSEVTTPDLAATGQGLTDSEISSMVTPTHGAPTAAKALTTFDVGGDDDATRSPNRLPAPVPPPASLEDETKTVVSTEEVASTSAASLDVPIARIMPHASFAHLTKEAMVAPCVALGGGDKGLPHDILRGGPPIPPNEAARAETMRALKLCSANPCPEIDVLLGVINRVMGVATSIMDLFGGPVGGAAWVCNAAGLQTGIAPWEHAACPWDLLVPHPTLMVVEDVAKDARFAHLPFFEGGLRTYISSPIIASDGHRLGGLCLLDNKVKRLDIGQCRMMNNFAEIAVRELERYADVLARLKGNDESLVGAHQSFLPSLQRNLAPSFDSCVMVVDASNNFELLYVSQSWLQWSGGQDRLAAMGQLLSNLLETVSSTGLSWEQYASDAKVGARFMVPRVCAAGAPPNSPVFDISFRCGALEPPDKDTSEESIPTFVPLSTDMGGIYIGRLLMLPVSAALRMPLETGCKVSTRALNVIPSHTDGQVLVANNGGCGTGSEELLVAVYQSSLQPLQRNLASTFDSCIMIIDVSNNFELLYVNHAWEQWSGGLDRRDAVGRPLPDLLESVMSNAMGMGLSWTQMLEEARGGSRFVVPRVRVRGAPSHAAVFDISFRCGALEALDNDTLPVAIPTFVQLSTSMGGLYIGRFHMLHDSAALRTPLETAGKVSAQTITAQQMAVNVIPGLELGQILGRGSYGTAYLAEWHDTQVVCKVQDHMLLNEEQRNNAEIEVAVGQELVHAHVVRTLAHGTIQLARRQTVAAVPSTTGSLGQANAAVAFEFGDLDDDDWVQDLDGHYSQACPMLHFIDMAEVNRHSRYNAGVDGADPMATQSTDMNSTQQDLSATAQHCSDTTSGGGAMDSSVMATASPLTAPGLGPDAAAAGAAGSPGLVVMSSTNGSAHPPSQQSAGGTLAALPSLAGSASMPRAHSTKAPEGSQGYPLELRVFLVLEFCDQGVLQDAIDRGWLRKTRQCVSGPAPCFVLRTALDIAQAMKYLHSKNIIHGDLTGFNILLKSQASDAKLRGLPEGSAPAQDQYGRWFIAKVADFGTSRRLPMAEEYIRTDSYATVTHMPPEMLKSSSMGLACDVWAFGVLLWSMWTGSRPWAGLSHAEIVAIVSHDTESLHFPADTPPALAALGMRCMSPSAVDRPTFRYVCREIRSLLHELWEAQKGVGKA